MRKAATRRGAMLLGLAALIFVGSFLTWTILQRSFDAYIVAANAEYRLQALAAAEGGVEWLAAGHDIPGEGLVVGSSLLFYHPMDDEGGTLEVRVVGLNPDEPLMVRRFHVYPMMNGSTWEMERLP